MPTPFMHLDFAERILAVAPQALQKTIVQQQPAFYLGSIAADYQTICDVPREATHFYPLPLMADDDPVGWERLLAQHPSLAESSTMADDRALFMAAYGVHLLFDVVWYRRILLPFFILGEGWDGTSKQDRFRVHHGLLSYLDRRALEKLPADAGATLAAADAAVDAPFIDQTQLARWQQMIIEQLAPDASIYTVAIYAQRLGIEAQEFAANLDDPQWLEEQLFSRVPLERVESIFEDTIERSVMLIDNYLTSQPASA